jgi:hypothetical protein
MKQHWEPTVAAALGRAVLLAVELARPAVEPSYQGRTVTGLLGKMQFAPGSFLPGEPRNDPWLTDIKLIAATVAPVCLRHVINEPTTAEERSPQQHYPTFSSRRHGRLCNSRRRIGLQRAWREIERRRWRFGIGHWIRGGPVVGLFRVGVNRLCLMNRRCRIDRDISHTRFRASDGERNGARQKYYYGNCLHLANWTMIRQVCSKQMNTSRG